MKKLNFDQFVERMYADTASNNWRKIHGYPLRRKSANRRFQNQKQQKYQHLVMDLVLGAPGSGRSRYFISPHLSDIQNK